jgi:hypothetical protein
MDILFKLEQAKNAFVQKEVTVDTLIFCKRVAPANPTSMVAHPDGRTTFVRDPWPTSPIPVVAFVGNPNCVSVVDPKDATRDVTLLSTWMRSNGPTKPTRPFAFVVKRN